MLCGKVKETMPLDEPQFRVKPQKDSTVLRSITYKRSRFTPSSVHWCSNQIKKYVSCCYVFFRILYSLAFTFTAFHIALVMFIESDLVALSHVEQLQSNKLNLTAALSRSVEEHSANEITRQQELVTSMQRACNHYIGELFESVAVEITRIQSVDRRRWLSNEHNASVSVALRERTRTKLQRFADNVRNFRASYRDRVSSFLIPLTISYKKYLERLVLDDWLSFPQQLFRERETTSEEHTYDSLLKECNLTGTEVDFASFMEIQEVEDVQVWPVKFWQRFEAQFFSLTESSAFHSEAYPPLPKEDELTANLTLIQTPLGHLQSTHFFTSQPYVDALPDRKHFPPDEYNLINPSAKYSDHKQVPPRMIFTEFITEDINADAIRIIFLTLDAILLIYRLSLTFLTLVSLRQKLSVPIQSHSHIRINSFASLRLPNHPAQNHNVREEHGTTDHNDVHTSPPQAFIIQKSTSSTQYNSSTQRRISSLTPPKSLSRSLDNTRHRGSCHVVLGRLLENNAFPKVVILSMFLVVVYGCLKSLSVFVDVELMLKLNAFGVFVNALGVQVNQSNADTINQAQFFNDVSLKMYESRMHRELLHLQGLIDHFNTEQKLSTDRYISDVCSTVINSGHPAWRCDLVSSPTFIKLPLLPCNFVPLQPHLFSGSRLLEYEQQLEASFQPPIDAVKNILLKSLYAILLLITAMIVLNILGWIIFRCLRVRQYVVVQNISAVPLDGSVQTFINQDRRASDLESDDGDVDNVDGRVGRVTRNVPTSSSAAAVYTESPRTLGAQSEFKFSETNV